MKNNNNNNKNNKKTNIDLIDKLPVDVREGYIARTRANWNSMPKEQKVKQLNDLHEAARGKIRQASGMIDHKTAILNYVNNDLPKQIEEILQRLEANSYEWDAEADRTGIEGYRDIARFLRDRRRMFSLFGIESLEFDLNLVDQPSQVGVQLTVTESNKERVSK